MLVQKQRFVDSETAREVPIGATVWVWNKNCELKSYLFCGVSEDDASVSSWQLLNLETGKMICEDGRCYLSAPQAIYEESEFLRQSIDRTRALLYQKMTGELIQPEGKTFYVNPNEYDSGSYLRYDIREDELAVEIQMLAAIENASNKYKSNDPTQQDLYWLFAPDEIRRSVIAARIPEIVGAIIGDLVRSDIISPQAAAIVRCTLNNLCLVDENDETATL